MRTGRAAGSGGRVKQRRRRLVRTQQLGPPPDPHTTLYLSDSPADVENQRPDTGQLVVAAASSGARGGSVQPPGETVPFRIPSQKVLLFGLLLKILAVEL